MKSLILYCKSNNNEVLSDDKKTVDETRQLKGETVEFHVNLWKTKNGVIRIKSSLIFDFGIKFDSSITDLCIFLPFRISSKTGVEDLGKYLSSNRDLLNAVFNEDMICQSASNHCFSKITNNNNSDEKENSFYIYHLGESNFKIEDYIENSIISGTYLTINICGNPSGSVSMQNQKYYVRFRVFVEDTNEVVQTEILSNDLLQAAFSRMDLFDIRINEKREIPSKVEEKMEKRQYALCRFNKLHFFYIVDTHERISNIVDTRMSSRLLEKDQWIDYEPKSNISGVNYIAHHWKKTEDGKGAEFSHFSLFFSAIYPKVSFVRLLAYFSIVVLLGWLGSMLSFPVGALWCHEKDSNLVVFWVPPIIVAVIIMFLVMYILKSNVIIHWFKFRRKL